MTNYWRVGGKPYHPRALITISGCKVQLRSGPRFAKHRYCSSIFESMSSPSPPSSSVTSLSSPLCTTTVSQPRPRALDTIGNRFVDSSFSLPRDFLSLRVLEGDARDTRRQVLWKSYDRLVTRRSAIVIM